MKKILNLIIALTLFFFIVSCKSKIDPITGKRIVYEENVDKRLDKAVENKGSIIFGGGQSDDSLANTSILWAASLDVLNFVPLSVASYNGGVISTEWYGNEKEKIKFEVKFKSNELTPTSFNVQSFKQTCKTVNNCQLTKGSAALNRQIKNKIIAKARSINIERETAKKKN